MSSLPNTDTTETNTTEQGTVVDNNATTPKPNRRKRTFSESKADEDEIKQYLVLGGNAIGRTRSGRVVRTPQILVTDPHVNRAALKGKDALDEALLAYAKQEERNIKLQEKELQTLQERRKQKVIQRILQKDPNANVDELNQHFDTGSTSSFEENGDDESHDEDDTIATDEDLVEEDIQKTLGDDIDSDQDISDDEDEDDDDEDEDEDDDEDDEE